MTEEEIASHFERVARELDVPGIEALVSGAERRGRRLRHRHRVLLAAGNVLAAVTIVVAVTTGVVPRLTRALGPASAATAGSPISAPTAISTSSSSATSRTASASPTTPRASSRTATAKPREAMTATQIMDDLRAMLPATSTISDIQDTSARIWKTEAPGVEFNYNDGQGNADVQFGIYPPDFLQGNVLDCSVPSTNESPRPPGAPPVSCTRKTLSDGSLLINLVTATDSWSFYEYAIDVVRPDGVTISLAVGNGTLHPGQPGSNGPVTPAVTRAVPPGSFGEWNAVAESPAWHL